MRLRVRPLGDAYVGPSENSEQVDYASQFVVDRRKSLGWISVLPDELILAIINQLPVADLARLSGASLAAHAFANSGNGWKEAVLDAYEKEVGENADSSFPLGDTWRARFQAHVASDGSRHPRKRPRLASRQVVLYSDVLAHLERCARGGVPEEWLSYSNIPRCHGLTAAEFQRRYESSNVPVVITDAARQWPSLEWLHEQCGETRFRLGHREWPLPAYLRYARAMTDCYTDDALLYLFDCRFGEKVPELAQAYTPPRCLDTPDLFALLGEQHRPDYRWLIVGPPRSGSTFHQDPNGTSAWNAVIRGRKKWVLLPPGELAPPGMRVMVDADGSRHVLGPATVYEWFVNHYDEMCERRQALRAIETVVNAGEVLFVPRGWWHCAMNLEPVGEWDDGVGVALTQNFCNAVNLPHVLQFLRHSPANVSGVPLARRATLYSEFVQVLQRDCPEMLADAQRRLAALDVRRARSKPSSPFRFGFAAPATSSPPLARETHPDRHLLQAESGLAVVDELTLVAGGQRRSRDAVNGEHRRPRGALLAESKRAPRRRRVARGEFAQPVRKGGSGHAR